MVFLTIAEAIMNRITMNIIARSMEISIRPTVIHRVARTEEGSDQDVKIRWVSKTSFDFFYFFYFDLWKIRHLVIKIFVYYFWLM